MNYKQPYWTDILDYGTDYLFIDGKTLRSAMIRDKFSYNGQTYTATLAQVAKNEFHWSEITKYVVESYMHQYGLNELILVRIA